MSEKFETEIATLVSSIKSLHPRYVCAIEVARQRDVVPIDTARTDPKRYSGPNWVEAAFFNALIKLRLIIEHNFAFIETLGLLATTRFVFELHVWLRLLSQNPDFGLIFFWQILEKKLKEHQDHLAKIEREITLFKALDEEERSLHTQAHAQDDPSARNAAQRMVASSQLISAEIDRRASRSFCLYADQAKINGYGYQALLIERRVVPEIRRRINETKTEIDEFKQRCSRTLRKDLGQWRWKDRAAQVGLADHFEFIYSYTSRLLHATPVSFCTDEKNLELDEVRMFLDYVCISLTDIIEMAEARMQQPNVVLH